MARILIPSDFSDNAKRAAEYAVSVVGPDHRFIVFNALSYVGLSDPMVASVAVEVYGETEEQVLRWAEEFRSITGAKNVTGRVDSGSVATVVRNIARNEGADLVVMGRSGAGGASLFGSNTTDVIRNTAVPVLAVPVNLPLKSPLRILLANDHHEVDEGNLGMLRTIALYSTAEVLITHIAREKNAGRGDGNRAIFDRALKGVALTFQDHPGEDVPSALAEAAATHNADMIAVLHRHRDFLDRMFNPSVARKLALESVLPLLVLERG